MKTNTKTGGQWIAQAAVDAGIRAAFCVPGESYLGVLDGLYDHQGQIRVIGCRHEHGASHAAEAWGKLMGKPALCMVTRGPGAANAAIGVHTAFQDSTPMVVLVGHVAQAFEGREAFQEVDFEAMFAPLAKAVRKENKNFPIIFIALKSIPPGLIRPVSQNPELTLLPNIWFMKARND